VEINFKGFPVHYEIIGEGKPLIFLHGFSENSKVWYQMFPFISKEYQCIRIDLPGFGKSALPINLSLNFMAHAINRVITELELIKPILIGHSMGGYVCLEMKALFPDLMSGIGLFHSTAIEDSPEKKENRLKTIDFLQKNPLENFFKVFLPGLFANPNFRSDLLDTVEAIIKETKKESVIAGVKAMLDRVDRIELLKASNMPWLFIAGLHDQIISVENMSLQASYCKKSMFEILFHSGHLGMLEEPKKSSEIILNFAKWVC
jgi:pimeloyl-ACP methyl ester carboxylesterase